MPRISLMRVALLAIVPFMLILGASFNGVVYPPLQLLGLLFFGSGLALWAASRLIGRWRWHPTALDGVIWLWTAAILVASLANPDMIRRSQPSLWWLTALMVGWYVIHDTLQNGTITRGQVLDTLLMAGLLSMGYAVVELLNPDSPSDGFFGLPRVGGLTGNPNLLSAILMPILGAALGRAAGLVGVRRLFMGLYVLTALVILGFTYSRGGWIGGGAVVAAFIAALVVDKGWTKPANLRAGWAQAKAWQRAAVVLSAAGLLAVGAAAAFVIVNSFDVGGRTADLRTYLWEAAWDSFTDKPLTGNGLYSTPRLILDRSSSPPRVPQPHAHNFPLQVLAELGILGGVALVASIVVALRAGTRAWRGAATRRERYIIAGGWAGAVGFGVHNMFDLAAWTPYVALSGLLVIMAMTAPPAPTAYPPSKGRRGALLAGVVGLMLLATGYYSHTQMTRNDEALRLARQDGELLTAAAAFDDLIAADPRQPVYRWNQAMAYAVAAYGTRDAALVQRAIVRFEEAAELGMDSAYLRYNLAALAAETGDLDGAQRHLERMAEYAADSAVMLANGALFAESYGLLDLARTLWRQALAIPGIETANLALMPGVAESTVAAEFEFPPAYQEAAAVPLLVDGRPEEAMALLDANPEWRTSRAYALRALAAQALGLDPMPYWETARSVHRGGVEVRWVVFSHAVLENDPLPTVTLPADPASLDVLDAGGAGAIARLHFMRQTFGRVTVPQAEYEAREPSLAYLADYIAGERAGES